ncbi:unnamed protein product [Linum tenue]|uniref:Uncharacterized protein n=1 Tax=Linum tenue TaxID=586396 RepID=A0AAV0QB64_9ROSI|nr:unnamed protein product [Linum tenue]
MEHPHNAVLLRCSSHNKGCRPFICNTSYRHSNCLDQYLGTSNPSPSNNNNNNLAEDMVIAGGDYRHELTCPLCRGSVSGWEVVEPVRRYLNTKPRECSTEDCGFEGSYSELRKHARSDHPLVRPAQAQPERQQAWAQMEQEEEEEEELMRNSDDSSDGTGDNLMVNVRVALPDEEVVELQIEIPRALLPQQSHDNRADHVEDVNGNVEMGDSSVGVENFDESGVSVHYLTLPEDIELRIQISCASLAPQSGDSQTDHTDNVTSGISIDGSGSMHEDNQALRAMAQQAATQSYYDQTYHTGNVTNDISIDGYEDNQAQPAMVHQEAHQTWNDEHSQNQNFERDLNTRQDVDFSWGRNRSNNALFQTRSRYGGMYGDNQASRTTFHPKVCWNGRQQCNQIFGTDHNRMQDVDFSWGRNRSNSTLFQTRNNMCGDNQTWPTMVHPRVCWNDECWNQNFERNVNVRRDANSSGVRNPSTGALFRTRNSYGGMHGENQTRPIVTRPRVHRNARRHRNRNFRRYLNVRQDVNFYRSKNCSSRPLFRTRNRYINEIQMHEVGLATNVWWMP